MEKSCEIYALHLGDHRYRYVGLTTVGSADRLWMHRKNARQDRLDWPVYRWMRKHGPENVHIEVLETVDSREELDGREIYWISRLASEGFDLLNCTAGGGGMRVVSAEVRYKLGSHRGRKHSPERRAMESGENHYWYGRKHTADTKAKMSANNGMKRPEVAARISALKKAINPTSHTRWHINRDMWSDNCEYCRFEVA